MKSDDPNMKSLVLSVVMDQSTGVRESENVPIENGTVSPSRRKYASTKASRVPVKVANNDS